MLARPLPPALPLDPSLITNTILLVITRIKNYQDQVKLFIYKQAVPSATRLIYAIVYYSGRISSAGLRARIVVFPHDGLGNLPIEAQHMRQLLLQ